MQHPILIGTAMGLLLILVNAIRKGLARRKEMKAKEELG